MARRWVVAVMAGILILSVLGMQAAFAQSAAALEAWEQFKVKYGLEGNASPKWSEVTGALSDLHGVHISLGIEAVKDSNSVEEATSAFIVENQVLLGVEPSQLKLHSLVPSRDPAGWSVIYRQQYQGVEVAGAQVGMALNEKGELFHLASGFWPGVEVSTVPAISESDALDIARVASGQDPVILAAAVLQIWPIVDSGVITYHLAWEITLWRELGECWCVVDAHDGQILKMVDYVSSIVIPGGSWGQVKGAFR